jgi:hypothetical protein
LFSGAEGVRWNDWLDALAGRTQLHKLNSELLADRWPGRGCQWPSSCTVVCDQANVSAMLDKHPKHLGAGTSGRRHISQPMYGRISTVRVFGIRI